MIQDMLADIGLILIIAAIFAFIGKLLRQPLIPFYIMAGILIGPVLGLIKNTQVILTLSELGIAFLLFNVGLEMNLNKLKDVEHVTIFGGLSQIFALFTIGFVVSLLLGFYKIEAIYLGLIIAFSSTMIVLKLLSDKQEIDTLHGRIIIGILLMQDIVAVVALSFLDTIDNFSFFVLFLSILKGVMVFVIALLFGKYIFPPIFSFASKSKELLFLFALSVLFGFSILFSYFGFSIAIGAFIAGLSLASLQYNIEVISVTRPLRDFFATIFFVSLGLELLLGTFNNIILPLIILLILSIIFKPLVIHFICAFYGYKRRISFFVANSLGQASEFSLIMIASGLALGHIRNDTFSIVVLLAAVTITITSYSVKYEEKLYKLFENRLKIFDVFSERLKDLEYISDEIKNHIVLIGYNRIGYSIVKTVKGQKGKLLVIDFNPEIIKKLIDQKINCIYGDASHEEIIERMNLKCANAIISTSPNFNDNLLILKKTKSLNKNTEVILTATQINEALELYKHGANYVLLPHLLGGEHISTLLKTYLLKNKNMGKIREFHLHELKERLELGKEHKEHR